MSTVSNPFSGVVFLPELPEVETIVRQLRPRLLQRRFVNVEILWERIVHQPTPTEFTQELIGSRVIEVGRRGKFLQFSLDTKQTWLVHLRMTGKFRIQGSASASATETPHMHARLWLDDGMQLDYIDPRKFGRFFLVADPTTITGSLGPEPLSQEFTSEWLSAALSGRRSEIKRLLLDQSFIAGLGNIYASEALWRAGIHPLRYANDVTATEAMRLHDAIVSVLRESVDNGGTSLADRQYVYPDGGLGHQQGYLSVYDRAGERCPHCGYTLERIIQAQRSTYFCPVCQPPHSATGQPNPS